MSATPETDHAGPKPERFARKLATRRVEKVWGRTNLPAPFDRRAVARSKGPDGRPMLVGEVWFEPPPELEQLLVKYLFTSEKLSVQVHPGDDDAEGDEAGKDECWLVLDAEPGAKLAIGFEEPVTSEQMKEAAISGDIEGLLTWYEAKAGDLFFLPAGTVHAIGPGLKLIEVQQNSDTTFRLYDYGRPRELHLERAMAVASGGRYEASHKSTVTQRGKVLFDAPHFRVDRVEGAPDAETCAALDGPLLVLPIEGEVTWGGEVSADARDTRAKAGECVVASSLELFDFSAAKVTLLVGAKRI